MEALRDIIDSLHGVEAAAERQTAVLHHVELGAARLAPLFGHLTGRNSLNYRVRVQTTT